MIEKPNRKPGLLRYSGRLLMLGLLLSLGINAPISALARTGGGPGDSNNETATKKDKDKATDSSEGRKADADGTAKSKALSTDEQVQLLNEKVQKMQEIIEKQQKMMDDLQNKLKAGAAQAADATATDGTSSPTAVPAASNGSTPVATTAAASSASTTAAKGTVQGDEEAPLQLKIGRAYITPVGFADFTTVFRSTNVGSGIGTNFANIPFGNTTAGNLTESRFSAQNSRFGFRVDAEVHGAHVMGYLESDFLGSAPNNLNVTSNSDAGRLRLYWVDVRKDKWEIMGGQSWSLMTPGKNGISPLPGDIFYSQNMDTNYQAGLVWARQAGFRFVYHPSDTVAFAVALENPEQYIGGSSGAPIVTLPAAFASTYASQLDSGQSTGIPNLHPDIIAKLAFDPNVGGKHMHIEFAGVFRDFKVYNPVLKASNTTSGGGGSVNLNLELFKNFHFITNNYYSSGGGRYLFGIAPDFIVRPDGTLDTVTSFSTVTGFEATVHNTLIYGYYGGVYTDRNFVTDPSTHTFVGYGFPGSSNAFNRVIHEGTFGITQTLWKDAKWGALQLITQYSYLQRNPWNVPAGTPTDAHSHMVFIDLRYSLPGAPPKMK